MTEGTSKVTLVFPAELAKQLKIAAVNKGTTASAIAVEALINHLGAKQ